MPTSPQSHPVGTNVLYRHDGQARRAQITSHHPETGEVNGLVVLAGDGHPDKGKEHWAIEFGVSDPKHAETAAQETVDGYFKKMP